MARLSPFRPLLTMTLVLICTLGRAAAQGPPSPEALEKLVAPIALYPDPLVAQVLPASTNPLEIFEAADSVANGARPSAETASKWDPSIQALLSYPTVLKMMRDKIQWTQDLGHAFASDQAAVLAAIQTVRHKASAAGNLKSTSQQSVTTKGTTIVIEPAQPDVIYVPAYDPAVVYGPWPYPYYPPYYWQPYPYYYPGWYPGGFAAGVFWGAAIGSILWGGCNWGGGDININVDRFNRVNHRNQIDRGQNRFQHNAANRKGVPYRDQASRDRYGQGRGGAETRNNFRGRDPVTEARRQQAQSTLRSRGMDPAQAREALRNDPATRQRAQAAVGSRDRGGGIGGDRGGGNVGGGRDSGGFAGAGGGRGSAGTSNIGASRDRAHALGGNEHALRGANNPGQSRQSFDRGSSSRQSSASFGGGGRGGGGGGGRGGGGRR